MHEIFGMMGFRKDFFQPRHFTQKCVTGLLEGWEPPSRRMTDDIIGYSKENLEDLNELCPIVEKQQDGYEEYLVTRNLYATTPVNGVVPIGHSCGRISGINPYAKSEVDNVL